MLSNEILFFIFTFLYMLFALSMYKLGKIWLQAFLSISYIITICVTTKFFIFFGYPTSAGVITYAGIFLATDMMTEKYGKEMGFKTIRLSFVMILLFIVTTQFNLLFESAEFTLEAAKAMKLVYGGSLRVMLAGLAVYLFAQHFDVWLYHKIHELTKDKYLWVRNNVSTFTSQIIDSLLFFTLAFYGTMPNSVLFEVLIVAIIIKLLIAGCDTPIMYLAKRIKPLDGGLDGEIEG